MMGKRSDDIFAVATPRVFSIDASRPFLSDLAAVLRKAVGADPLSLAEVQIFVPTRRAARALVDAFAATAPEGRASLLPRIRPLGDIDEDELVLGSIHEGPEALEANAEISPVERLLVLTRMVAASEKPAFAGQSHWPAAVAAARELASLLDSFHTEEIGFAALADVAPSEHAAHWERSLEFLKIITSAWPQYLAKRNAQDASARRARLIRLQAERFHREPPHTPVIIAGTTGSAPAVARLIDAVSRLPAGAIVLPGLDRTIAAHDPKAWSAIDDPHPQAGLKALLDAIGVEPAAVAPWPGATAPPARGSLLSLALRPAEATDDWRDLVAAASAADSGLRNACAGLSLVEAADEDREASAIALMLREALETPEHRAMLVTPDRNLARRVSAKMRRWSVTVDDSAGVPFANTPCGAFLRLAAVWLSKPSDPVAVVAMARHPLAGFGLAGTQRRRALSTLDIGLRGVAPGPSVDALAKKINSTSTNPDAAAPILDALRRAAQHWPAADAAPFAAYFDAHLRAAEAIAANADETGAARLWRGEDGDVGAALLAEIKSAAFALGAVDAGDYAQSFAQMISGVSVRRRLSAHPRLAILGPLEARLQSADLVILGGLNDGVWPADAALDPFMSREMRKKIGLPSPERRLGQSAHDFAQLAAAPAVVLTRASVSGGAPAKPSRWIVRLKNVLHGAGALDLVDATLRYDAWTRALDQPAAVRPAAPPAPRPPLSARPRKLAVTRFEDLLRDPYSVYGRYILNLRALDPLAQPIGYAQLGGLLHRVFETVVRDNLDAVSQNARTALSNVLTSTATELGFTPAAIAFWRPRLEASLDWFLVWSREQRARGKPAVVEQTGERAFDVGAAPFTLTATADRIDLLADDRAALFDYKSGALPTLKQVEAKFSPQLPLTALIVEAGGFPGLGPREVESFSYVKALNQKNNKDDLRRLEELDARACIDEARRGFSALVAYFDNPQTPYLSQPRPQFQKAYAQFDQLARRREWEIAEESE